MNTETTVEKKKNKKRLSSYLKVPHVFALIFFIILITAALTYIIPSGEFDRVEDPASGRTLVEDGSYHSIPNNHVSPIAIPRLIIEGLNASSGIILFIFVVGGSFRIITSTGAFDAVISSVASKLGKREILIIPILMSIFAIGGATIGMSIEALGLVPLVVALARSLKYDALTGMSIVLIGAFCGFIAGVMNPFTVGVAQEIAGLPIYSGMWLRVILLVVLVIVSSIYIIRYAKKVKADPSKSLVADLEEEARLTQQDAQLSSTFQLKDFLVILTFVLGIGLLVWGVTEKKWYIEEMAALFLAMAIISGICAGFSPSRISEEFIEGAKAVILGALIVGIARTIPLVLEEGNIIDSLVYGLSNIIMFMPDSIKVISIYLSQNVINFFINSGSGQAAVTMPIMIPLGDLVGLTRQTTVLSFHLGDGFTNLLFPTGSTLMAYLAATGISYEKWLKFIWPLMIIFISIGAVFVVFASLIHY